MSSLTSSTTWAFDPTLPARRWPTPASFATGASDTTTIDLCLSLFPWAHFQRTKAAVKVHTQLDLRDNIPTFLHIVMPEACLQHDGKSYDSDILVMRSVRSTT